MKKGIIFLMILFFASSSSVCFAAKILRFTSEQDQMLLDLVNRFGTSSWIKISNYMPGFNPKSCRERYKNYLQPDLNLGKWTDEEEETLISKQAELGNKWSEISKFIPGRSLNNIKNRFHLLKRHNRIKCPDSVDVNSLTEVLVPAPELILHSADARVPDAAPSLGSAPNPDPALINNESENLEYLIGAPNLLDLGYDPFNDSNDESFSDLWNWMF